MKCLILITLLFSSEIVFGQKIIVDLYFFDACKDSIHSIEYTLIGKDGVYVSTGSLVEIDSAGWYVVSSGFGVGEDKMEMFVDQIEVINTSKYTDTLFVSTIRLRSLSSLYASKAKYYNCDNICNGYEKDYFSNGNIKTKGKIYNGNGKLLKKEVNKHSY
jgi:hypothetical protein